MRKIISICILIGLPILATLFWQCNPCGCSRVNRLYTKVRNISFWHQDSVKRQDTALVTIPIQHHSILLNADLQTIASNQQFNNTIGLGLPSAYACSCVEEGDLGLKNKIKSIEAILAEDYDAQHLKGQKINDLIYTKSIGATNQSTLIPLDNSLEYITIELGLLFNHNVELQLLHTADFYKKLSNQPNGIPMALKFKLVFDDNSFLETAIQKVILTN